MEHSVCHGIFIPSSLISFIWQNVFEPPLRDSVFGSKDLVTRDGDSFHGAHDLLRQTDVKQIDTIVTSTLK